MIDVSIRISSEEALSRIEIWLRASITGEWQLEFGGVDDTPPPPGQPERRRKPRLLVRYRFADPGDAEKFRKGYKEGWVLPLAEPKTGTPPKSRPTERPSNPQGFTRRVLSRLSSTVAGIFARAPAAVAKHSSAAEAGLVTVDAFSAYVAEVVRRGQWASASKVQLIGLDRLQAHFGTEWPRVARRADEIARRTIRGRLGKSDVFTAIQGWKYLILFPELSVAEAQIKSTAIAEEISRAILGDQETAGLIEVRSAVMTADGGLSFELTPTLEDVVQTLSQRLDVGGAESVPPAPGASGVHALPPDNDFDPAPAFSLDPLDVVQVWYRPIFDMRLKIVAAYQATPAFEMPDGSIIFGESRIPDFDLHERHYRLDLMLLTRAVRDLNTNISAGKKRVISVGVNFDTLAVHNRRMEYLRRVESVFWPARQLLVFQIKNLPDGASPSRLHEMIMTLKRHARAIMLQLPINTNYVSTYRELALHSIGVELSDAGPSGEEVPAGLPRFAARARKAGMEPFIGGLATPGLVEAAVAAGYRYLAGDGIAPARPNLEDVLQAPVPVLGGRPTGGRQDKFSSAPAPIDTGPHLATSPAKDSPRHERFARPPGVGANPQPV